MKPETILNGLIKAHMVINNREIALNPDPKMIRLFDKSARQYRTFRNRILKMFAEKDEEIIFLNKLLKASENQINGYQSDEQKKDARIAELEGEMKRLEERMGVYRT